MSTKKNKESRGRPSLGSGGESEVVRLRVDRARRARWEARASEAGLTLSEWIRQRCDADESKEN